jgi:hypothetical protein
VAAAAAGEVPPEQEFGQDLDIVLRNTPHTEADKPVARFVYDDKTSADAPGGS